MLSKKSALFFDGSELVEQELDRIHRAHGRQDAAQDIGLGQGAFLDQKLVLAGARAHDVDGGEDALVGDLAVQDDFAVTRALELFEDHFVHAAAGIDQGGGDDGERSAFLDIAGGAEKALGALQGVGVHAAGQDLAR